MKKLKEDYSMKIHIPKDALGFVLSLPIERKIPSHGTGNYTCNSRAARRRTGKTNEEK
jgi:hypothetical protein